MPQDNSALWLAEEWGRQFTRTVESMIGEPVLMTLAAHELTADDIDAARQDLLWWEQPLSLSSDTRIWIAASSHTWQEIGKRVLRGAGVDDAPPDDARGTYLEIVNQSLSGVASAFSTRVRKEISCLEGHAAPPLHQETRLTPSRSLLESKGFRCWPFSRSLLPTLRRTRRSWPKNSPASLRSPPQRLTRDQSIYCSTSSSR